MLEFSAESWLFVTSAARYADAVPWALLRTAQERATAVAVVLDRVPPEAVREVGPDLRAMLDRADLPDARLFVVEEGPLIGGRLPLAVSAEVRRWLHGLATDREARAAVVRQTLDGALDSLRRLIGAPIAATVEPWCYEATRDNIRHYAHGIGDDNPLWCDPAYAAGTRYGTIIAPPSFVFALDRILSGYVGGLPGIHAMWAGADLTWERRFGDCKGKTVLLLALLHELNIQAQPSLISTQSGDGMDARLPTLAVPPDAAAAPADRGLARGHGGKLATLVARTVAKDP